MNDTVTAFNETMDSLLVVAETSQHLAWEIMQGMHDMLHETEEILKELSDG